MGTIMKAIGEMTVLVTGASGGIGAAIAERFASVGMNVVLHYMKSHEAANEAARRCMEQGNGRIMTVSADLRSGNRFSVCVRNLLLTSCSRIFL